MSGHHEGAHERVAPLRRDPCRICGEYRCGGHGAPDHVTCGVHQLGPRRWQANVYEHGIEGPVVTAGPFPTRAAAAERARSAAQSYRENPGR